MMQDISGDFVVLAKKAFFGGLCVLSLQCSSSSRNDGASGSSQIDSKQSHSDTNEQADFVTVSSQRDDGSRGSKVTIPASAFIEEDLDIEQGEVIANDVTAAYLTLPPRISPASSPVYVGFKDPIEDKGHSHLGQISISLPLEDEHSQPIGKDLYDKLLVLYQIESDQGSHYGYLSPGSFQIKPEPGMNLDSSVDYAVFYMQGEGIYQVALLPEDESLPESDHRTPSSDVVKRFYDKEEDGGEDSAGSQKEALTQTSSLILSSMSFSLNSQFVMNGDRIVRKPESLELDFRSSKEDRFDSLDNLSLSESGLTIFAPEQEQEVPRDDGTIESPILDSQVSVGQGFSHLEIHSSMDIGRKIPKSGESFLGSMGTSLVPSTRYHSNFESLSESTMVYELQTHIEEPDMERATSGFSEYDIRQHHKLHFLGFP